MNTGSGCNRQGRSTSTASATCSATTGGFWYTADLNLALLHESVQRPGLDPDVAARVRTQIETLRAHLAEAPKSRRWKIRAKVGTRKRWYQQVEEVS